MLITKSKLKYGYSLFVYFYIGSMISIITLIALISYLTIDYIRQRPKEVKPDTSTHPYTHTIENLYVRNTLE